jgi:hypothetical protein
MLYNLSSWNIIINNLGNQSVFIFKISWVWIWSQTLAIQLKIICYFYVVPPYRCLIISFYILPHSFIFTLFIIIHSHFCHGVSSFSILVYLLASSPLDCTLTLILLPFAYLPSLGLFTLSLVSSVIIYLTSSFVKQINPIVQCKICPYHCTLNLMNFSCSKYFSISTVTTVYFMVALGLLAESKIGSFGGGW